jgi:hypothetical protein
MCVKLPKADMTLRKPQVAGQRDSAPCGDAILTFGLPTGVPS